MDAIVKKARGINEFMAKYPFLVNKSVFKENIISGNVNKQNNWQAASTTAWRQEKDNKNNTSIELNCSKTYGVSMLPNVSSPLRHEALGRQLFSTLQPSSADEIYTDLVRLLETPPTTICAAS